MGLANLSFYFDNIKRFGRLSEIKITAPVSISLYSGQLGGVLFLVYNSQYVCLTGDTYPTTVMENEMRDETRRFGK